MNHCKEREKIAYQGGQYSRQYYSFENSLKIILDIK
ncbi:hypothetical protein [uncultured Megasphaera sp.]